MSLNTQPLINTNPVNTNLVSVISPLSYASLDIDSGQSSFSVNTGGNFSLYIDKYSNIGINTTSPSTQLEIASANGACLKLRYGGTTAYGNIFINSSGYINITSSGGQTTINNNFNLINHNGSTTGLLLNNTLVTATAAQLNYNNTTAGTAAASKALILDSSSNISGINSLSSSLFIATSTLNASSYLSGAITTSGGLAAAKDIYAGGTVISTIAIATSSGGTGISTYAYGDLLAGTNTNTLTKISASTSLGNILTGTNTSGLSWEYNYFINNLIYFPSIVITSSSTYTFGQFYGIDSTSSIIIKITSTNNSINLSSSGVGGLGSSINNLTGTIYPTPLLTTITGISTLFTTEIATPQTVITLNGQSRKVVSITNDTTAIVDTPFTILNLWSLGSTASFTTNIGQFKFGTAAFNGATSATTSYALLTLGSPYIGYTSSSANLWTLEFWIQATLLTNNIIICSSATSFTFQILMAKTTGILTLSLGQGTSFNIASGVSITGALVAGTYKHIAVVFTGSAYKVYINGVLGANISSSLAVSSSCFNSFFIGANNTTAFNGYIDEVRLSNIVRYSTAFTVASSAFTFDVNTLSLNHFDNTSSITLSDVCTASFSNTNFTYKIDGLSYSNTVYYGYAITNNSTNYNYIFSSNSVNPQLPSGYTYYAPIPFYAITNSSNNWIATNYSGNNSYSGCVYNFMNLITIINTASNVNPTILNTLLTNYVPANAIKLILIITHNHLTTTSCGISIGHNSLSILNTILTTATVSAMQMTYIMPIATNSIDTFLTATATGTTYSIQLAGFYT